MGRGAGLTRAQCWLLGGRLVAVELVLSLQGSPPKHVLTVLVVWAARLHSSPRPSPRTESQHHHSRRLLSAQPSWGAAPGDQYHKCLLGARLLRSQPRPRGAHTLGCDSDCVPAAPGKGWSLGSTVPAPRLCMGAASILHSLLCQLRPGLARRGWVLLTFPARTRRPESGSSRGIRDLGERDGRSWEYSQVPVTEGPQQG